MKLIEKLKEMFFERELDMSEKPPSLFDRLRNVFFSAEFLAADLDRVPPDCKCEDAIAHLDGRCRCTISPKEFGKSGSSLTTEKTYLMGKFARAGLGTRYIDYNGPALHGLGCSGEQ